MKQYPTSNGFTLIETLLATAMLIFMVVGIASLSNRSLTTWRRAAVTLNKQTEETAFYDRIIEDFEVAVFRNDNQKWLGCSPLKVGPISTKNSCWLRFFISTSTGVRAVSYHIRHFAPSSHSEIQLPQFGLYRHLSSPQWTLSHLLGRLEEARSHSFHDSEHSEEEAFISASFLTSHVLRFQIKFFYRTASNDVFSIDPTLSEVFFPLEVDHQTRVPFPESVDITLTLVDSYGAQQLSNGNIANKSISLDELINNHGITYTKSIMLHNVNF